MDKKLTPCYTGDMGLKDSLRLLNFKKISLYGLICGTGFSLLLFSIIAFVRYRSGGLHDWELFMEDISYSLFNLHIFIWVGFLPGLGIGLAAATLDNFFKPADRPVVREVYDDDDLELQKEHYAMQIERKKRILTIIFTFLVATAVTLVLLFTTSMIFM
jgi:hypothetical protein